jgi:predicted ABC-type ATPase
MKAIFVVGGPGSGKDIIFKTSLDDFNLLEINSDKIYRAIINQENLSEMKGNPSIIVNGNADNYKKIMLTKNVLEAIGYETAMIFVYSCNDSSKQRCKSQRSFDEEKRSSKYMKSMNNMQIFNEIFNKFYLFDNSADFTLCEESEKRELANWFVELKQNIGHFLFESNKSGGVYDSTSNRSGSSEFTDENLQKQKVRKERRTSGGCGCGGDCSDCSEQFTEAKKTKKTKNTEGQTTGIKSAPPMNQYFNSNIGAVPAGSIGLTAYKTESTIHEAVEWHLQNDVSFVENVFRPGTPKFFELMTEARRLYQEGEYIPYDEYEHDLLESDIGEFAEYNGKMVPLDYPFIVEGKKDPTDGKGIGKPFRQGGGGAVYVRTKDGVKKITFSNSGMPKKFNDPERVKSFVARHNCLGNKDKTSAAYWACRWPRYFSNSGKKWW